MFLGFSFFFLSSRFCMCVCMCVLYEFLCTVCTQVPEETRGQCRWVPCVCWRLNLAPGERCSWHVSRCPSPCFALLECLTLYLRLAWNCCWSSLQSSLTLPIPQGNFLFQPFLLFFHFPFCPFVLIILLSCIAEAGVEVLSPWFTCQSIYWALYYWDYQFIIQNKLKH